MFEDEHHYKLCWDCFEKDMDFYMDRWRKDIAGHSINITGKKCDICGQIIEEKKKKFWKFW